MRARPVTVVKLLSRPSSTAIRASAASCDFDGRYGALADQRRQGGAAGERVDHRRVLGRDEHWCRLVGGVQGKSHHQLGHPRDQRNVGGDTRAVGLGHLKAD